MTLNHTPLRIKASNDALGERDVIEDPNDNFFVCSDGHPKVRMVATVDCPMCYGNDEIGHDFCPVCEYCCGC